GMSFNAWTYSGTVPGPVLKVMQGDEVNINLVNHTKDAHGINVHAAQISPDHFTGDPMKSVSYSFTANVPGVFIYHCTAPPILDHIASGMYGMMIVEPKAGWPNGDAQEVTIVQSELYGLPDAHGFIVGSHGKIVQARPDFVVFNGALNKYSFDHPIDIKVGKLVRLFFVNAGPSFSSAFYVTGVLFDTVYKSGNPANAMHGINTLEVPPSDGAVFEFRVTQPGYYQFMDQNRAQQYKGANGVFRATP
ncbi:MAG: multicopper oxidase domain-containing protein, partial [Candidatus Binataceae bacterium]